jgi:tripartite-type tricarboxylate transporter receptor subunit TctC
MVTPEAQTHFTSLGMQPTTGTPAQAHDYIVKEAARWTQVIKGMGISVE